MPDASQQKVALEFKSTSLTVPALLLASNDLASIEECLRQEIARNAEFFRHSPIMIDMQRLNDRKLTIDVKALVSLLRELDLVPISLRGGSQSQDEAALAMGISLRAPSASAKKPVRPPAAPVVEASTKAPAETRKNVSGESRNKYINQPIRSGQRVYSQGDLTITATVSAGAEIMAEGNIHVYGSLRGRALAGVQGDTRSRIFCMDLQAELLSIAGVYQLRDDIPKEAQHKSAHISLDDEMIVIKEL